MHYREGGIETQEPQAGDALVKSRSVGGWAGVAARAGLGIVPAHRLRQCHPQEVSAAWRGGGGGAGGGAAGNMVFFANGGQEAGIGGF